ncbi:PREDICTED: skin secretory protein xP2-like [Lepidothrix coronata]|uniref:Skin secretory protein xP2-like n=1 Tax=Lepidothrix coronata TaxID=321398 RepID=A0A6J0GYD1_9PASS|nr:PREDICTED: skin secretory protein xP2-like [Lepidothrix coronata]
MKRGRGRKDTVKGKVEVSLTGAAGLGSTVRGTKVARLTEGGCDGDRRGNAAALTGRGRSGTRGSRGDPRRPPSGPGRLLRVASGRALDPVGAYAAEGSAAAALLHAAAAAPDPTSAPAPALLAAPAPPGALRPASRSAPPRGQGRGEPGPCRECQPAFPPPGRRNLPPSPWAAPAAPAPAEPFPAPAEPGRSERAAPQGNSSRAAAGPTTPPAHRHHRPPPTPADPCRVACGRRLVDWTGFIMMFVKCRYRGRDSQR